MNNYNFHCCSCYEQLSYLKDHVELKPCRCVMCPKCLLSAHAQRGGGGAALTCPGCHSVEVEAHEYIKAMETSGAGEVVAYHNDMVADDNGPAATAVCDVAAAGASATEEEDDDDDVGGEFHVDDEDEDEDEKEEYKKEKETVVKLLTLEEQKPTADAPLGRYPNGRKRTVRPKCKIEGCTNNVQSLGVCVMHGAKKNYCTVEGCTNGRIKGGVCIKHGAKKKTKRCKHEGCTRLPISNGACSHHGGVYPPPKPCSVEGCERRVASRGLCRQHGGKPKCKIEGCEKYVARGGLCQQHNPDFKPPLKECVKEGCTMRTRNGTCSKHCKFDGCTNQVIRLGLCHSHGGHQMCSVEDCFKIRCRKGMCYKHFKEKQRKENEVAPVAPYIDADDGLHPVSSSSLLPRKNTAGGQLSEEGFQEAMTKSQRSQDHSVHSKKSMDLMRETNRTRELLLAHNFHLNYEEQRSSLLPRNSWQSSMS